MAINNGDRAMQMINYTQTPLTIFDIEHVTATESPSGDKFSIIHVYAHDDRGRRYVADLYRYTNENWEAETAARLAQAEMFRLIPNNSEVF